MSSRYAAAVELEQARQLIRDLVTAGREVTLPDRYRVFEAEAAYRRLTNPG